MVWSGLDTQPSPGSASKYGRIPIARPSTASPKPCLGGARVLQLEWSPDSRMRSDKDLRQAIAVALQGDRTSDSLVPTGVEGHTAAFPLGGKAKPKVTWKNRINLTLGYDSTMPNGQDLAAQIRSRLENTGGLSVQLRPGDLNADLNLVDRKAWTSTALAWLQPYLDAPLPAVDSTVSSIENEFRATTDGATADRLLAAAAEAVGRRSDHAADQPVRRASLPTPRCGDVRRLVRPWLAAGILRYQQCLSHLELSGVRRGPFEVGERITLTDPKGRRHSIVLAVGGLFHTTKGSISHDDLIAQPEGMVVNTHRRHAVPGHEAAVARIHRQHAARRRRGLSQGRGADPDECRHLPGRASAGGGRRIRCIDLQSCFGASVRVAA